MSTQTKLSWAKTFREMADEARCEGDERGAQALEAKANNLLQGN